MKLKSQILRASLESAEAEMATQVVVTETPPEVVAPVEDEGHVTMTPDEAVEGQMAMNEAETNVSEADAAINQIEEAAQSMEAIYLAMESAQSSGGMTPESRAFAQIAFETAMASIGVQAPALPSMESFGGQSSRASATRVSMEAAAQWIEKLWEAIKAAILKAKEFVVQFIGKILDESKRIEASAKKVLEAADKVSGDTKNKSFTASKSAARFLTVGGVSDPVRVLGVLAETAKESAEFDDRESQELVRSFGELQKLVNGDSNEFEVRAITAPRAFKHRSVIDGVVRAETDVLPGGKKFYITAPEKPGKLEEMKLASGVSVYSVGSESDEAAIEKVPTEFKFDTMSPERVKEVAKAVMDAVEVTRVSSKVSDENSKQVKMISSVKWKGDTFKAKLVDQVEARQAIRMFQNRANANGKASAYTGAYTLSAANAMLSLATASLKQYGVNAMVPVAA